MIALLASPWGAPALALLGLLAVMAGAGLGATWDRLILPALGTAADTARAAWAAYRTPPTGGHRR